MSSSDANARRRRSVPASALRPRQAEEARRANLITAVRRYQRRRWAGWVLLGLSVVMIVVHFLAHVGTIKLFSLSLQDVLIGYPTAAVLVLVAVLLLGQIHPAERKAAREPSGPRA